MDLTLLRSSSEAEIVDRSIRGRHGDPRWQVQNVDWLEQYPRIPVSYNTREYE